MGMRLMKYCPTGERMAWWSISETRQFVFQAKLGGSNTMTRWKALFFFGG